MKVYIAYIHMIVHILDGLFLALLSGMSPSPCNGAAGSDNFQIFESIDGSVRYVPLDSLDPASLFAEL